MAIVQACDLSRPSNETMSRHWHLIGRRMLNVSEWVVTEKGTITGTERRRCFACFSRPKLSLKH